MLDNNIILGVTETTARIFDEEFPSLKKVEVEPYRITYSKTLPFFLKLLVDAPRIFRVIKKENQQLKNIIKQHGIDVVISDNRFGLYNKDVESIYMTHQLDIQMPMLSFLANAIHHHFIKQFNTIWIPDFEDDALCLAGNLSRNKGFKSIVYIGPQSRLSLVKATNDVFDYLCILSGPEPQRSMLETELIQLAEKSDKRICIVRGSRMNGTKATRKNIVIFDLPDAEQLSQLIANAKTILFRSGYSTLMDLHFLDKKEIILIPTPGQTEQNYLAEFWKKTRGARIIQQKEINQFQF